MLETLGRLRLADADALLVAALPDPDPTVGMRAAELLVARHPWLVLGSAGVRPVSDGAASRMRFGAGWLRLRRALFDLAAELGPWQALPLRPMRQLPGLLPDLMEALEAASRGEEVRRVACEADPWRDAEPHRRQILLAPTYACNLDCTYCYVKGWRQRFGDELTLADLQVFLRWCRDQGVDWVILGGGEPTVHRAFGELLEQFRQARIRVSLTSNGLFGPNVRESIRPRFLAEFVCHVDQRVLLRDDRRAALLRANVAAAVESGLSVRLRYTLTGASDHHERKAMLEFARDFRLPQVNYGFAFRNMDGNNDFFVFQDHSQRAFDAMLAQFMDEANAAGIALHLSKPIPLCYLSRGTLRRLAGKGGLRTACTAYQRRFSKNLTVNPDLRTMACNALGRPGSRLTDFADFEEAGKAYASELRGLYQQPWQPRCGRCVLHYRGICQGVCLAERRPAPSPAPARGEPLA